MKTLEFMDKKIMELSRSKSKDSFTFFSPDEDSDDDFTDGRCYGFDPNLTLGTSQSHPSILNSNYADNVDSGKVNSEEVRIALVSKINQTIKEHFDNLLHSVDGLSARLSQVESKMRQLENAVDNLKISDEYNNGRTVGKLRQLENILREVQDDVHFLREKQETTEAQLLLAKLQDSKSYPQPGDYKTAGQYKSEQSPQPPPISGGFSLPLPTLLPDPPSTVEYKNTRLAGAPVAAPLHSQILKNPIPSRLQPESYYFPVGKALDTTYQQYNVSSPSQKSQPPPPVPPQSYQPAPILPQVIGESTLRPQLHPTLSDVNPQNQYSWIQHHHEEAPPLQPHNYHTNMLQFSSLPADGPPIHHQFYMDFSQQMHGQLLRRPNSEFPSGYSQTPEHTNFGNMHTYNGYCSSTTEPSEICPSSSVQGGRSDHYTQLPKGQILPHVLPTASSVDTGSSSGRTGNKVSTDDVVDRVTVMGFRRDLVRATVRKLTQDGQSVDLNVVLDKLMNDDRNI